jgi:signal transduction histidine kinase/ligand-binding sensor domain-containing protein
MMLSVPVRTRACRTLLSAALACALSPVPARAADNLATEFDSIGHDKGLTTDIVTALYQDRSGMLWIGSRDGLRSYDGYSFRFFDHDIANPQSLSDNAIRTLYEDSRGRFWVGTNAGGLELLDRASGGFRHFRYASDDPHSISHDSVYAVVEGKDGMLWVGTQRGLNRLDPTTLRFERTLADPSDPTALSNDYVAALHVDARGALWVATVGGGLLRHDPQTGHFKPFRYAGGDPASINSDRVFAIAEDAAGRIWIGTDRGVAAIDAERGVVRRFGKGDAVGLPHDTVTSLAWGPDQTLWVGTLDGIDAIAPSGSISHHTQRDKPAAPADLKVTTLLLDQEARLWIGTWGAGLVRRNLAVAPYQVLEVASLDSRDVTALSLDRSGGLWVGTLGGGLGYRGPQAAVFRRYDPRLFGGTALSVLEAKDGAVWVGTYEGLERIAPGASAPTRFGYDPARPESLGRGYVTALLQDRDGRLWIGTGGSGLQRLAADGLSFEHFRHDDSDPASLSDDYVTVLHEDQGGTLWVGTRSGGLNECDRTRVRCRRHVPGDKDSLTHHYVTSIHEGSDGRLWIGTAGGGLNLLSAAARPKGPFLHFTVRDGLPDNNVMSIAEDAGRLWLGTKRGLARLDPATHEVVAYGPEDGLPLGEFNGSSSTRDERRLYFGTTAGLLSVPRGQALAAAAASPTVFTAVRTLIGTSQAEWSSPGVEPIEIPHGTILGFEAAVLDYSDSSRHRYQYQLAGLSEAWVDLSSRRGMTFADLSPGSYTLHLKGRNGRGVWSSAPPLQLRVVPPFWMRSWFRALLALAGVALILGVHQYRTAALRSTNRHLLEIESLRERALTEAQASGAALHLAYERLQTLTRRIEAVAEEERRRIAHELHDEMGQILTAAKINLQLLSSAPDPEARLKRMEDTLALIDDMISRVRALSLDLRPPLLDELGLMPALRAYAESQARRADLAISIETPPSAERFSAQIEITAFRVIQEAVTNAIRHARARRVEITVELGSAALELTVRDDGCGFDAALLQAREAAGEGHLGLAGIRQRVQLLGGDVSIRSEAGAGTRIEVAIPLSVAQEAACG